MGEGCAFSGLYRVAKGALRRCTAWRMLLFSPIVSYRLQNYRKTIAIRLQTVPMMHFFSSVQKQYNIYKECAGLVVP